MSTSKRFRGIPIVQSGTKYQTEEGFSAAERDRAEADYRAAAAVLSDARAAAAARLGETVTASTVGAHYSKITRDRYEGSQ